MQTNTRQPREAVIQAFHYQEKKQNTTGGLTESQVHRAIDCSESVGFVGPEIMRQTLEKLPTLAPLDIRGKWKGCRNSFDCDCPRCSNCAPSYSFTELLAIIVGAVILFVRWWR